MHLNHLQLDIMGVGLLLLLASAQVASNASISNTTTMSRSTSTNTTTASTKFILRGTPLRNDSHVEVGVSGQQCYCMEQWNCTLSRGEVYSYCGSGSGTGRARGPQSPSPSQSQPQVCCLLTNQIETNATLAKAVLKPDQLIQLLESSAMAAKEVPVQPLQHKRASSSGSTGARVHCGQSLNGGVVDGVAKFKEWPWHVAILEAKGDLYICGGSFLENDAGQQLVLTAGHCVTNYAKSLKRLKVRLGEYDVTTNSEPLAHVEVLVKSIELYPRFKNNGYLQNDVAILRLNNSIRLQNRDNIRPICLPESQSSTVTGKTEVFNVSSCVVTGWGRKYEHSEYSVSLKEIPIPIWDHKTCEGKLRIMFGPSFNLSGDIICAGGNEESDTCDGDGGGPLVCFDNVMDKWVQQGIVSWGIGCGRNNPGIYTRVSSYMSWIKSLF